MTHTCDIYWKGVKVSSGTATTGSATIASTTDTAGLGGEYAGDFGANVKGLHNEDVIVHCTSGSNAGGKSWKTRVVTDNDTSIVMADKDPFTD